MNEQPESQKAKAEDSGKLETKKATSRRNFFAVPAAAAVAAATLMKPEEAKAASSIAPIQKPKEFDAILNQPIKLGEFASKPSPGSSSVQAAADSGMTGADVFARLCVQENLAAMFCCPGNYQVIGAIASAGIPSFGGRNEGMMCSAADGFSRVTGEVVAASGTEGPGFTQMIMAIAGANAARTPLLVLASNMAIAGEDREAGWQVAYQQPTTEGMKKWGKRIITPNRIHEYGAYAFRQLKSGVPGPVHLDFPNEVSRAIWTQSADLKDYYDKSKYRTESRARPSRQDIVRAMDMIGKAERPLIVAGQGVFQRKAWDQLKLVSEKQDIAVATSGPTRGHFADDHQLSVNVAPEALMSADLVIFVGQYCMPSPGEYRFNPDVKAIRVHPVQEDLGRNWPLDLGVVSDERFFLEELANDLPSKKRERWVDEIAGAQKKYQDELTDLYGLGLKYSHATERLHPAVLAKEVHDFLYKGDLDPRQTVTGWGGWMIGHYASRWLRAYRPGQEIVVPYQYYPIGPDVAMVMGAGLAVKNGVGPQAPYRGAPVLAMTGDAGIAFSIMEFDTATKYKVPVIAVVYNNNAWGVWPNGLTSNRALHLYLFQENLRYDQIAINLGARGEYVQTPDDFRAALKRAYAAAAKDNASTLINCQGIKEFSIAKDYPPGVGGYTEPGVAAIAH
jgi:thiamine pyrophosphate-dependent acetolactate synthase large subunit-like protein